jgi:hypothetical protein
MAWYEKKERNERGCSSWLSYSFIQELENAPTSIAMFLVEYVRRDEGRSPVLVITYQQDFRRLLFDRRGPKNALVMWATAKPNSR